MRYLLDTHALIWFMNGDQSLPEKIIEEIKSKNNDCFVSIASLWEITIKLKIGKLELPFDKIEGFLSGNDIKVLPVNYTHLKKLLMLDLIHRDPFDRIIIAQGIAEKLAILTADKNFRNYPVNCVW